MIKNLMEIPRTQRTAIICETVIGLFYGLTMYYLPLYQAHFGLTSVQIGQINSIGMVFGCVATILAGPIANKFPRRNVLLVSDLISWSLPVLLWSFADSYAWFLLAASINAVNYLAMGAWQGLLHEGVPDSLRARIISYTSTAFTVASAFTPLTALFFARFTMAATLKTVFFIWFICQTAMLIIRHCLTVESDASKAINAQYKNLSVKKTMAVYFGAIPGIFRDRNKAMFCALFLITQFVGRLSFIHVLYLNSYILLPEGQYSLIPTISAITCLVATSWIIPALSRRRELSMARSFYMLFLAGTLLFIFLPRQNLAVFLLAAVLLTGGSFLAQVYKDSAQMNYLGNEEKAMVYSIFQTMAMVFCIPAGYVGGALFAIRPWLPYCLSAALIACAMIITTLLNRSLASKLTVKTMSRAEWKRVTKRAYCHKSVANEDFSGDIGLLRLLEVREPLAVDCLGQKVKIADKNYKWLQFAFKNQHYWLTVMFDENDHIIQFYYDITYGNFVEPDGDSWFYDLYLDVVVFPDGRMLLLDEDELDEALKAGVINRSQYELAHRTAVQLMDEIRGEEKQLAAFCMKYFTELQAKEATPSP